MFALQNNVALYGGFFGTEQKRTDRAPVYPTPTYPTLLRGDINRDGVRRSTHVVAGNGLNASAVLDGFRIINGNATVNASGVNATWWWAGGGLYLLDCRATLANLTIDHNNGVYGGGLYLLDRTTNTAPLTMSNITIDTNTDNGAGYNSVSYGAGAAIINVIGNITLSNVTIKNNTKTFVNANASIDANYLGGGAWLL